MAVLGECVLGAAAAETLGVGIGDTVISSPETVFDLAGIYPLKMTISGILEKSFTPDDEAIFVDVKTAWIIQGLGHGHQDLADPGAASSVLQRSEDNIVANAALMQYNEINADNADSFHFHGDLSGYPLTAVIAVPKDDKSGVLLRGRYTDAADTQIVRPLTVIDELLDTILTIQQFIVAAVIIVGLATIATAALVFLLSLRLRRREIDTMLKIGGSRPRIAAMLIAEVVIVLVLSGTLATAITLLTWRFGPGVIESLVIT